LTYEEQIETHVCILVEDFLKAFIFSIMRFVYLFVIAWKCYWWQESRPSCRTTDTTVTK